MGLALGCHSLLAARPSFRAQNGRKKGDYSNQGGKRKEPGHKGLAVCGAVFGAWLRKRI